MWSRSLHSLEEALLSSYEVHVAFTLMLQRSNIVGTASHGHLGILAKDLKNKTLFLKR